MAGSVVRPPRPCPLTLGRRPRPPSWCDVDTEGRRCCCRQSHTGATAANCIGIVDGVWKATTTTAQGSWCCVERKWSATMAASKNNGPTLSLLPRPVNALASPLSPEACSPKLRHEAHPIFWSRCSFMELSCRRCGPLILPQLKLRLEGGEGPLPAPWQSLSSSAGP